MTTPLIPTPAAPAGGQPATPTLVPLSGAPQPLPAQVPGRSAVQDASDRARAAIASGQPLADVAPPAGRVPPTGQPAPVAPAPAPAAPVAPTGQPAPAAAAAPGTPAAPATPEAAPATPEAAAPDPLTVEIPLGETDDDTLVIKAETPEMAEQVRELVTIATEAQALTEEVETLRGTVAETEELREYADADPIGFTLDMIGKDVNTAKSLVMFLLTQPTLYAQIKDELPKLADPLQFKLVAADAREARYQATEQANDRIETSRAVRQNLQDVQATVHAMLPDTLTPQQRQVAYRDCLRDLQEFANSKELVVLPVQHIPSVLAARLDALGIDPEVATARATAALARNGGRHSTPRLPVTPPVNGATRTPPAPAPAAPKRDGAAFLASASKKRDAGAIPNAGAGSPNNTGGLDRPVGADGKPLGIKDTLAWHRQRMQKGIRNW